MVLTSLIQPVTFPTPEGYSPFLETEVMPPWDYIPTPRVDLGQQISPWRQVDEVVIEEPPVTEELEEHILNLEAAGPDIVVKVKISLEEYRSRTTARNQNEVISAVHNLIQFMGNSMDDIFLHNDRSVSESGDLMEITDDILINPNDKRIISITRVKDAVEECAPMLEGEEIPTEIRKVRILGQHTPMLVWNGQITPQEKRKRQPSATPSCAPPSPEGETMAVSPPLPPCFIAPLARQSTAIHPAVTRDSPSISILPDVTSEAHDIPPVSTPRPASPMAYELSAMSRHPSSPWPQEPPMVSIPDCTPPVARELPHTIPSPLWPMSHQWIPQPIPPPLWPVRHRPSRMSNFPYLGNPLCPRPVFHHRWAWTSAFKYCSTVLLPRKGAPLELH